jgi:hypothetical protein
MDRDSSNGVLPVERYNNARLIAAAPELLEACKGLLAVIGSIDPRAFSTYKGRPEDVEIFHELAELAIAKAEGNL